MIKTPDVVNLDKSHVSFCGKAFRFRQEIERSLHETKSEISWNREAWVHETKSEFVRSRGTGVHEIMSEFVGLWEASSPSLPARSPSDSGGEGGATFLAAAKKAVPEKKKVSDTSRILLYEN